MPVLLEPVLNEALQYDERAETYFKLATKIIQDIELEKIKSQIFNWDALIEFLSETLQKIRSKE